MLIYQKLKKENCMKKLIKFLFICFFATLFINMGTGERNSSAYEPTFTSLENDEPNIRGIIESGVLKISVEKLSFSGVTKLPKLRSPNVNDKSLSTIELAKIKEIKIEDSNYEFENEEWILAKITTIYDNKAIKLLIPRRVILCGIDKEMKIKKAWFLKDIDKIEILHKK